MIKNSTQPILLQKLFELMESHQSAFGQERIYWGVGRGLQFWQTYGDPRLDGLGDDRWGLEWMVSAFQLWKIRRAKGGKVFFRETLEHSRVEEPYVAGVDGVQIPRSSG